MTMVGLYLVLDTKWRKDYEGTDLLSRNEAKGCNPFVIRYPEIIHDRNKKG
jgi:hypothetical protein